jgi:hypothetical protein
MASSGCSAGVDHMGLHSDIRDKDGAEVVRPQIMDKYAERKFILVCVIVLISCAYVALKIIPPESFQVIIGWVMSVFIAGDVWEAKK